MSRQVSHLAQICLQVGGGHKGLDSTLNSSTVLVIEREKVRNQTACDYKVKTAVHSNEHQIVRLTPTFLDSFNSDLMPLSISLGSFRFFMWSWPKLLVMSQEFIKIPNKCFSRLPNGTKVTIPHLPSIFNYLFNLLVTNKGM